jgi:hypothetical protein
MQAASAQAAPAVAHMPGRGADIDLYRACTLCDHGPGRGGPDGCCTLNARQPLPVALARLSDGPCGRDAEHMRIRGWDLRA